MAIQTPFLKERCFLINNRKVTPGFSQGLKPLANVERPYPSTLAPGRGQIGLRSFRAALPTPHTPSCESPAGKIALTVIVQRLCHLNCSPEMSS
jgi:hypothetical protein